MNFLQVSLTSRCNFSCWHCPMAKFRNTDDPVYHLNNDMLIQYLEKWVKPEDWVIELTGGEPSLYDGIQELLNYLNDKRYKTLVKTNGSGRLPLDLPNVTIVAAFHKLETPPKYFNKVLIVDKIDAEDKVKVCKANGWDYRVIGYNKENPDSATHGFTYIAFIEPTCHQTPCPARPVNQRIIVKDGKSYDEETLPFKPLVVSRCCSDCKAAIDAWRYL